MKETNTDRIGDLKKIQRIAERIKKYDEEYISLLMSEAAEKQTYFSSSIMQFTGHLEQKASEDMLSLYLMVWGLFRQYKDCLKTAVTHQQFERVQQRNLSMFSYLNGEEDNRLFGEVVQDDHGRLNNGAVMQYISHCFQSWSSLKNMDMNDYCIQLIGIKSFIECFEEIAEV